MTRPQFPIWSGVVFALLQCGVLICLNFKFSWKPLWNTRASPPGTLTHPMSTGIKTLRMCKPANTFRKSTLHVHQQHNHGCPQKWRTGYQWPMKTLYVCRHLFTDHSGCPRNHRSCLCIREHEEPEGCLQMWSPSNMAVNVTWASADTGKWDRSWAPPTRPASVSRATRTSDVQLRGHLNVDSLVIWKTQNNTDYIHGGGSLLTYIHIYASSQRYIIFLVDWSGNQKA